MTPYYIFGRILPKLEAPEIGRRKLRGRWSRIHKRPFFATTEVRPFVVELNPDAHDAGVDQDAGVNVASNDDLRAGEDDVCLLLVPLLLADQLLQRGHRLVDQLLGEQYLLLRHPLVKEVVPPPLQFPLGGELLRDPHLHRL